MKLKLNILLHVQSALSSNCTGSSANSPNKTGGENPEGTPTVPLLGQDTLAFNDNHENAFILALTFLALGK
jgi:hypothetical protein